MIYIYHLHLVLLQIAFIKQLIIFMLHIQTRPAKYIQLNVSVTIMHCTFLSEKAILEEQLSISGLEHMFMETLL